MSWLAPALALLVTGAPPVKSVRWERDIDSAFRRARKADRPLMVDFYAAWCGWCRRLDQVTYVDPEVVRLSEEFVPLKVNTEGSQRELELAKRYEAASLPTIVFLTPEGRLLWRVDGFQGPGVFPATLARAHATAGEVMAVEKALRRDASDAEALTRLGQHLFEQQDESGSRELLQKAIKRDERLPVRDRKRSRMLLALMLSDDRKYSQAETLFVEALALRPADAADARTLYMLARTYIDWGERLSLARATLRRLITEFPHTPIAQKGRELLHRLERREDEGDRRQRPW